MVKEQQRQLWCQQTRWEAPPCLLTSPGALAEERCPNIWVGSGSGTGRNSKSWFSQQTHRVKRARAGARAVEPELDLSLTVPFVMSSSALYKQKECYVVDSIALQ